MLQPVTYLIVSSIVSFFSLTLPYDIIDMIRKGSDRGWNCWNRLNIRLCLLQTSSIHGRPHSTSMRTVTPPHPGT